MEQQYQSHASYDPINSPIMDPERQIEAPEFGAAAVTPLALLGLGLAGAAAFALIRRRKPTLQERVLSLLEDSRDEVADFAKEARRVARETQQDVEPLAESAREKGMKLFKRGSKAAGKALHTASEAAQEAASELFKRGSKAADQAYEQAQHFSKHEGRDLAKQASKASKEAVKAARKEAQKGRKSILSTYQALEEKYPILTGLLVAALMSEGQKLVEHYRTREA